MKARIRKKTDAETVFERMHCDLIKKYYDKKTGMLKNETEFLEEIHDDIIFINQERQKKAWKNLFILKKRKTKNIIILMI